MQARSSCPLTWAWCEYSIVNSPLPCVRWVAHMPVTCQTSPCHDMSEFQNSLKCLKIAKEEHE